MPLSGGRGPVGRLFRALVIREVEAEHEGPPPVSDPVTAGPVPAGWLIGQLLAGLRPARESTGDWEFVSELARSAMARGGSAERQRAAYGRGGLRRVVDTLIAETRTVPPWSRDRRGIHDRPVTRETRSRRAEAEGASSGGASPLSDLSNRSRPAPHRPAPSRYRPNGTDLS